MSQYNNAAEVGQHLRAPTTTEKTRLRETSRGFGTGEVDLAKFATTPAAIFPIVIPLLETPDNNAKESIPISLPFPVRCFAIDLGCKAAAGTTAVADIHRKIVGGSFASVLDAAEDIKTGANAFQRVAPESTVMDWDYTDQIKLVVTGGGSGAVTGAQAILWCQLR